MVSIILIYLSDLYSLYAFKGFLPAVFFFKINIFKKVISGIPSKPQTVWIQDRPNILWGMGESFKDYS